LINNSKCIAVIPARGGSKRLKRKNIKQFNGKPLIAWSIYAAKNSNYIDEVIVSTEDKEIADLALSFGANVPYMRPVDLSKDNVDSTEPVLDILNNFLEYQQVVLLQPTSPLRTTLDIDKCIELSVYNKGVPCIAVTNLVNDFSVLVNKDKNNIISQFTVKNDNLYKINGAVYTSASDSFKNNRTFMTKNTICYEMPKERSIDIDTILDFKIAEELFKIEQLNNVD
tara:strand:+ start:1531 stop:2208 length:678 start_codon:yes stop_codon:yes gene_type:complete